MCNACTDQLKWMVEPDTWLCDQVTSFNPYTAELFRIIFHSFEAGIADAISSSKWRKKNIIMQKYTSSKCNYQIF